MDGDPKDPTLWTSQFNATIPSGSSNQIPNDIIAYPRNPFELQNAVAWSANAPILGAVSKCPQTCRAKLLAPALAVTSCTSHLVSVDYTEPVNVSTMSLGSQIAYPLDTVGFLIDIALALDGSETVNVVTGYTEIDSCKGILNLTACTLESAVGEYNVLITENAVSILPPGIPTIKTLSSNTRVNHNWSKVDYGYPSTLAGIVAVASSKWESG